MLSVLQGFLTYTIKIIWVYRSVCRSAIQVQFQLQNSVMQCPTDNTCFRVFNFSLVKINSNSKSHSSPPLPSHHLCPRGRRKSACEGAWHICPLPQAVPFLLLPMAWVRNGIRPIKGTVFDFIWVRNGTVCMVCLSYPLPPDLLTICSSVRNFRSRYGMTNLVPR